MEVSVEESEQESGLMARIQWWGLRAAIAIVAYYLVIAPLVAYFVYYDFPRPIAVNTSGMKPGMAYPDVLYRLSEPMVGNWMPNDIFFWPTRILDNPQNFQLGQLEAIRHATRILRDHLSRIRTTDKLDPDCDAAYVGFSNDPYKLAWARTEWRFGEGLKGLGRYRDRLERGEANFYPRADNLHEFIAQMLSMMGGVSQRLANAPRDIQTRISEETAGDLVLGGEKHIHHQTPWLEIDDNFYYARGTLYVLYHLMKAIRHDFSQTIEQRNAGELVDAIIEILSVSQLDPVIVTNGNPASILANHSLGLQARLEDARQKMRSLQSIMER